MTGSTREFAGRTLSCLHRPMARWHLRRDVPWVGEPLRIRLGAWSTQRSGCAPTDVQRRCRNDVDTARTCAAATDSVACVPSDIVIEHREVGTNRVLFHEALRVIHPGRRMRVVTPDGGALVQTSLSGPEAASPLREQLRVKDCQVFDQIDFLHLACQGDEHHTGYQRHIEFPTVVFQGADVIHVLPCPTRECDDPKLQGFEIRVRTPVYRGMVITESVKLIYER